VGQLHRVHAAGASSALAAAAACPSAARRAATAAPESCLFARAAPFAFAPHNTNKTKTQPTTHKPNPPQLACSVTVIILTRYSLEGATVSFFSFGNGGGGAATATYNCLMATDAWPGACQFAYSVASISILLNFLLSLMQVCARARTRVCFFAWARRAAGAFFAVFLCICAAQRRCKERWESICLFCRHHNITSPTTTTNHHYSA
jgi:hypothetical protein